MAAPSIQKASTPAPGEPLSPDGGALRAIADELRRIGDALSRTANHVTSAAAPRSGGDEPDGPAPSPEEEALFQSLRQWRADEARKLGMPPYIVATDKALRALAQRRPATVEELKGIPGFGPAKAAKYGSDVVGVVAGA